MVQTRYIRERYNPREEMLRIGTYCIRLNPLTKSRVERFYEKYPDWEQRKERILSKRRL